MNSFEGYTLVLQELLEILIPEQINRRGVSFEERFHLKSPEQLVRVRRLDKTLHDPVFSVNDDLALPAGDFNHQGIDCRFVVITENQMTFLTLPPIAGAIAIYGGGFQVEVLKNAKWLDGKAIIYWGDIDAYGFIILSRVRQFFPSVVSVMMDEVTLEQFRYMCWEGSGQMKSDGTRLRLTESERALFHHVASNNLRLEQEHISQEYISAQFKALMESFSSKKF